MKKIKFIGLAMIAIGIMRFITSTELRDSGAQIVEVSIFNPFTQIGILIIIVYFLWKIIKNNKRYS